MTAEHRQRPARPEPRDIVELRELRAAHPELGPAVDMQIELVELFRRMALRIPTPPSAPSRATLERRLAGGERLLELEDLPLEWSDVRFTFRQTTDILARYDSLETPDQDRLAAIVRDSGQLESLVREWYAETVRGPVTAAPGPRDRPAMFDDVAALALRPFLARTLEVTTRGVAVDAWQRPWCPYCGAQPDFAVVVDEHGRDLMCSRCMGRWPWEAVGCPWCPTRSRSQLPMFASRDRRYRVYGCQVCRRYLKAYDARGARRPVMPAVDGIATLPLDAAALQQGFVGS
jgi:ribosomal protein L40E